MRVPYTWLKDFIDIDMDARELAEKLTFAGIEVDEIVDLRPSFSNVITAEVLTVDKHPDADRLFVTRVSDGKREYTVVAGIDNFAAGDKVPLALPGAKLPGGVTIKRTRLRGVESNGMLCSAEELDLALNPGVDGILVLDPETPVGVPLEDALLLNDPILVLDLTPNRADCLGLIGVAKEVAALTGRTAQFPDNSLEATAARLPRPCIIIRDTDLCSRYTGLVIRDVKIGPSPLWLQVRLLQAGLRPINNIVDITNYVMWEWGQPLHAFDYDTLNDHTIMVRRAEEGEKLVTLDQNERQLTPDMLVIADSARAVGLAGVMGGIETEVTEKTKAVLLESAHFDRVSIRRTGRSLGLFSEAQQRFEKGVDVNGCSEANRRAARLIEFLGAGFVDGDIVDEYPVPQYPRKIRLRPERARRLLGLEISQMEMASIFRRQGFAVEEGTLLHVTIPTLRQDLQEEVDLIEEVARIYGYDKIATTLLQGTMSQGRRTEKQQVLRKIREIMVACGLTEVICYSFVSPRQRLKLRIPEDSELYSMMQLANPLSEEQSVMRTMLLGGLLETVGYNHNRNLPDVGIFEVGTVFLPAGNPEHRLPVEQLSLGIAMSGSFPGEHWQRKPAAVDFFTLKGIVETVMERLGISDLSFAPLDLPWCQPGQTAKISAGGVQLGWLGRVHPEVLDSYELAKPVYAAEINVDLLHDRVRLAPSYRPLPRYPAVLRDLAVVVSEDVPAAEVAAIIKKEGGALVEEVTLFDQYRGKQIPDGCRSLAFAITYRDHNRTLSDEDVNNIHRRIETALAEHLGADLRR